MTNDTPIGEPNLPEPTRSDEIAQSGSQSQPTDDPGIKKPSVSTSSSTTRTLWLPFFKEFVLIVLGVVLGLFGQAVWESQRTPKLVAFEAAGTMRSQTFAEDLNVTRISYYHDEVHDCAVFAVQHTISKEHAVIDPDSVIFIKRLGIGNKGRGVAKAIRIHAAVTGPAGATFQISGGSRLAVERLTQSGSTSTYLLEVDRVLTESYVVLTAKVPVADHPVQLDKDPVWFHVLGSDEGQRLRQRDTIPVLHAVVMQTRLDNSGPSEMVFGGLSSRPPHPLPTVSFITKQSTAAQRNIRLCVEGSITPAPKKN